MYASARSASLGMFASALLAATSAGAESLAPDRATRVNEALGLVQSSIVQLDLPPGGATPNVLPLLVNGVPLLIELEPHSVRAASYQVLIERADGRLVPVEPGPVRTLRGSVIGIENAVVAGSMEENGLNLWLRLPWGDEFWLEPLTNRIEDAQPGEHVLYDSLDVLDHNRICGVDLLHHAIQHEGAGLHPLEHETPQPFERFGSRGNMESSSHSVKVAELAVDADYQYYVYWGSSVSNVEARINSIIGTVNAQYETQVGIRHALTTIIVRTSSNQPYTHTDAQQLLNQFRNHWNANHGTISRDVAHLFTGKNLNGNTIGIAWVGVVCNLSYGYALSQSDFNNNYASATDLTAHELGHNWNALHCSCPQHTMNASITSANNFHPTATIPTIVNFRNSRTCLDDGAPPDPGIGACCMNGCFQTNQADCVDLGGAFAGAGTACADAPCGCPSGQVQDCNGNCAPASWIGDGICDDGSYAFNGVPIYFNCEQFDCDGGDCHCDSDPDPDPDGNVINVATGDHQTVYGSVTSGSYATTHTQNGVFQSIREQHTGGPPQNRISILDHRWTFNVAPGESYVFYVDAYHTPNNEGDHFVFSYSKNNQSYTPMLTVTATSNNNQYQSYVFPEDVAGLVYIRVQDTDQTPGNNQMDTVYIDHMYILSTGSDGNDPPPTAPAAPNGLSATAGNGVVTLNWNDNAEADLAGYNVYRATDANGPYEKINGSLELNSSYHDSTVTNGTTYHYHVTAVNTSDLESGASDTVSATPSAPGGDATAMHVAQISLSTIHVGQGRRRAVAVVTIVDNLGAAVQGASVTGDFGSPFNEMQSGTTNASGQVTLQTDSTVQGNPSFQFCVTNATHDSLDYASSNNIVTCANH